MDLLRKYGKFLGLVFGIVAFILLLIAPALYIIHPLTNANILADHSALNTIFGNSTFDFNVLGFIAILLLVVGLALRFVTIKDGMQFVISAVLLLVAGVLFFLYPTTIKENPATATFESGLGLPLILAGVFTIVAAVIDAIVVLVNKKWFLKFNDTLNEYRPFSLIKPNGRFFFV